MQERADEMDAHHEAGIKALLNSQLFIDAGYHQVKVYPDELAPFLERHLDRPLKPLGDALPVERVHEHGAAPLARGERRPTVGSGVGDKGVAHGQRDRAGAQL